MGEEIQKYPYQKKQSLDRLGSRWYILGGDSKKQGLGGGVLVKEEQLRGAVSSGLISYAVGPHFTRI